MEYTYGQCLQHTPGAAQELGLAERFFHEAQGHLRGV